MDLITVKDGGFFGDNGEDHITGTLLPGGAVHVVISSTDEGNSWCLLRETFKSMDEALSYLARCYDLRVETTHR